MTQRHSEIINEIQKDNIQVIYKTNLGSPGKYSIDNNGNCSIEIDCDILNGSDPNFPEKRIELVLHHEWGHIIDYRKDPAKFVHLNSLNQCHEDLEYEAYRNALQIAFNEAKNGDMELLDEVLKRYPENMTIIGLVEGYKKALTKIFQSNLWQESLSFKNIHDYKKINNRQEYVNLFKDKSEVLKQVLDIRKFEIELYWKRTTFFWTIITAIIAGYFLIYSKLTATDNNSLKILFSLGCLGLIFSIGWYFVNRGSKFWQVNWEKHLDCIEDEVIGPLYKTTIDTNYYHGKFFSLIAPYPFSVSKINQILNIVLIVFWTVMLFDFSFTYLSFKPFSIGSYLSFYLWTGFLTVIAILSLFTFTHTGLDNYFKDTEQRRETTANFEKRGLK